MKSNISIQRRLLWQAAKRYMAPTLLLYAALSLIVILIAFLTYNTYSNDLPSFEQLHNIQPRLVTKVYSEDGRLIKEFYKERRILIAYSDIPPSLKNALLATEDRRFYKHWGVDPLSVIRALFVNMYRGGKVQGGSTLTQQLARTLFLSPEKIYARKIKEVLTAIKLERNYSKNEIMAMYLNQQNFGGGAYGIQTAAELYFGKNTKDLDDLESATLVAMLKAPNRYSPVRHADRTMNRRNLVLNAMVDYGALSSEVANSLVREPLSLNLQGETEEVGAYFIEMVRQYLEERYGEDALYDSGYSVYTTLNYRMQTIAENVLHPLLDSLQINLEHRVGPSDRRYTLMVDTEDGGFRREYKKLQGALVCFDNRTGGILALVGGRDFEVSKFNRAVQAKRQPGSAFKPFVYTVAMDNGFGPTDKMNDSPIVLTVSGEEWRPHNIDDKFMGIMSLRDGLSLSRNLIAIKLIMEPRVTPQQAVFYAHQLGIKSPLHPVPSLAIGTSEVNLLELTAAYSAFPNGGIRTEPFYITKVTDRYGSVLEEESHGYQEEVLSAQTAYIMTDLLQSVINEGTGRGTRSRGFDRPAGGKTGTSDDWTDNWFIAFVPQITTGVWVGFDDKTKIGLKGETGSSTALPVWTEFMKGALADYPVEDFRMPPGLVKVEVCRQSGLLPNRRCPKLREEVFRIGEAPKATCSKSHRNEFASDQNQESKDKQKRESKRKIRF